MINISPIANVISFALFQQSYKFYSHRTRIILGLSNIFYCQWQCEFGDVNLTLLCQYMFAGDNLALLIKSYMQVMIVLKSGNLILWKTSSEPIIVWMRRQLTECNNDWFSDVSIRFWKSFSKWLWEIGLILDTCLVQKELSLKLLIKWEVILLYMANPFRSVGCNMNANRYRSWSKKSKRLKISRSRRSKIKRLRIKRLKK